MVPGYTRGLGIGQGARARWHHVPSPQQLRPGPAGGWWLSLGLPQPAQPGAPGAAAAPPGSGVRPAPGSVDAPQAVALGGVTCPPTHLPVAQAPRPPWGQCPAPVCSRKHLFPVHGAAVAGGQQENTSCLGGLFITCCQRGRPDRPAASPLTPRALLQPRQPSL